MRSHITWTLPASAIQIGDAANGKGNETHLLGHGLVHPRMHVTGVDMDAKAHAVA